MNSSFCIALEDGVSDNYTNLFFAALLPGFWVVALCFISAQLFVSEGKISFHNKCSLNVHSPLTVTSSLTAQKSFRWCWDAAVGPTFVEHNFHDAESPSLRVSWWEQFGTRSFLLMRCDITDFICRINQSDQVLLFYSGGLNINLCNNMEVILCKTPEWETLRGDCFLKLNLLLPDSPSLPPSSSFRLKLHNQVSSCCLSHTLKYTHTHTHTHI